MMKESVIEEHSHVSYAKCEDAKNFWANNDNDAFFDRFTPDVHDECLFNAGLATNKDLTFIQELVQQAETILEIGAGYGRIVNGIKAISQQTHIDAIEKNPLIFKQLRTLSHVAGVTLYNQDIFDFLSHSNKQYDLVLLLWSTLAVFSPAEQFTLLERLKCHLNRGGKIVIDFFLSAKGNLKPHIMNNYYHVIADQTSHFGYLCPRNRLKKIVEALGYANINFYEYTADQEVIRQIAILDN
jgi:phospholipid N-methyltransferase